MSFAHHAASGRLRTAFSVRARVVPVTPLAPYGLPEFLGLVADDLSLPTHELALNLRELIRIFHPIESVQKVERAR